MCFREGRLIISKEDNGNWLYIYIYICVYYEYIILYVYVCETCEKQRWTSQSVSSMPGIAFRIVGQDREVKSKWVWWPLLPEKLKTRVWQWWGDWNWYWSLQKQKASALSLGVLIMSFAKDWAFLYLPQVMFCKVLLRKKKKKEQLEKIPGITNQISSDYSNHFFENTEKRHDLEYLLQKGFY